MVVIFVVCKHLSRVPRGEIAMEFEVRRKENTDNAIEAGNVVLFGPGWVVRNWSNPREWIMSCLKRNFTFFDHILKSLTNLSGEQGNCFN